MRRETRLLTLPIVVAAAVLTTGCSADPFVDPDRSEDAAALAEDLRGLSSVATVTVDYSKPIILDSGKLALRVRLDRDAQVADAIVVLDRVYEAFSTTHSGEEGDLDLLVGDDRVHLRTFSPQARSTDVLDQAARALALAQDGRLDVRVTADSVPREPHVETSTTWVLGAGSTAADLPAALSRLRSEHDHPGLEWSVGASDGASVGGAAGVPDETAEQRWRDLSAVPLRLPGARASIAYDETTDRQGRTYSWVEVDLRATDRTTRLSLDDRRTLLRVRRTAAGQVELMRGWSDGVAYRLLLEGREVALADDDLGAFGEGPGRDLARDLLRQ